MRPCPAALSAPGPAAGRSPVQAQLLGRSSPRPRRPLGWWWSPTREGTARRTLGEASVRVGRGGVRCRVRGSPPVVAGGGGQAGLGGRSLVRPEKRRRLAKTNSHDRLGFDSRHRKRSAINRLNLRPFVTDARHSFNAVNFSPRRRLALPGLPQAYCRPDCASPARRRARLRAAARASSVARPRLRRLRRPRRPARTMAERTAGDVVARIGARCRARWRHAG